MLFKIMEIRLVKSFFTINEDVLSGESGEFTIDRKLNISIADDEKNPNILMVALKIRNESENSPFNFDVVFEGIFEFDTRVEISNENFQNIGLINCSAIIFPFVREHLADLTRRSGLPAFHLPPVNFVRLHEEQEVS